MAPTAADLAKLAGRIRGSLLAPEDPEHDSYRKWFIATEDEVHPQTTVRCVEPKDVVEALRFVRSHRLPFAVRSGGHSYADYSTTAGVLIDLGLMDLVNVDGEFVQVGAGVRVGRLAVELAKQGRVVPLGWCTTVGVCGSVLGGGFGPFGRFYGLSCDHLVAAQVVLADGRVLWVDTEREPGLFWALRGAGGGNFGVVISMVLRTRPAVPVANFASWWGFTDAARVIDGWQRWAPDAPDEINAELVVRTRADPLASPEAVLFGVVVGGRERDIHVMIERMSERIGAPVERVEVVELPATEAAHRRMFAGEEVMADLVFGGRPRGKRAGLRRVKSDFFERPVPAAPIAKLVERFATRRTTAQVRALEFIPWGGALHRVPASATAFVHRSQRFLVQHDLQAWGSAEQRAAGRRWLADSWAALHPWGSGYVYQNFPDPELADWARAYYGSNLGRLQQIKARYDPTDLFRSAQSIRPSRAAGLAEHLGERDRRDDRPHTLEE